ncbi:MAG TPA: cytochrome P450 [Actinophytocola sp.]|jgi:cytochrome P450|uniref:cytochrome P450 family protein n=1 Tax=Actinophytocola sp. TaxID=1872138 RepID=UPI002F95ACB9
MTESGTEPKLLDLLFDRDRYRELRDSGPVTKVRHFNGSPAWLVTRHEDVMAVLADPRVSSNPAHQTRIDTTAAPGLPPEYLRYLGRSVSMMDPPDHTRVRRLVSKVFTARRVQELRPRVQRLTDDLLDDLEQAGELDLLERFAYPLPFAVISELLGVPEEFRAPWRAALEGMMWGAWEQIAPGAQTMVDYAVRLVHLRRDEPGDDLTSALVRARDADGDQLDDDELISLVITILNAGHETSAQLIANGTFALLSHPDQLALLRANPKLLPSAIEEMLRYWGAAELAALRFPTEPIEVGGVRIEAGEVVQLLWGAANRDEARFADPEKFDITRKQNLHVSFGHGIHYCLGAALARMEGSVALSTLLQRYPELSLAAPAEQIAWKRGFPRGINRLEALPIRFGARRIDRAAA